jgi:predicted nuclease of predicted toxin-antitoxin system
LSVAVRLGAVLVTADKDFGELVFRLRRASGGVVLLRLSGTPSSVKIVLVVRSVEVYGAQMAGAFTVITPRSVRLRKLSGC